MTKRLWQDVRYAARALRRTPAFTLAAIVTLALGLGANTAIFSLLNAVLLEPLRVPHPEELVVLNERVPHSTDAAGATSATAQFSLPQYERFGASVPAESIAATSYVARMTARLDREHGFEPVAVQLVTPSFFPLLGVSSAAGRLLADTDDRGIDQSPVAIISHAYWVQRFAAAPDVVGMHITIDNVPFTIIGVAASRFDGLWLESPVDIWLPQSMQHAVHYAQNFSSSDSDDTAPFGTQEGISWLTVVVRVPAARGAAMRSALSRAYHDGLVIRRDRLSDSVMRREMAARTLETVPVSDGLSRVRNGVAAPLWFLMGLVGLVLLIACVNLANLMLARGAARQPEIWTRLSLGAGRWDLVRPAILESLLIVLVGGAVAVAGGYYSSRAVATLVVATRFTFDPRVLAFLAAAMAGAVVIFGLLPALQTTRTAQGHATGSRIVTKTMPPLAAVQIGLALVLVVAAVLFARTLANLGAIDPGFSRNLVTVSINPEISGYAPAQWPALHARILDRLAATPGVRAATLAVCGLANGCHNNTGVVFEGLDLPGDGRARLEDNYVAPGYFATVGIPLLAGRAFTRHDGAGTPRVAIVNEATARRYLGGVTHAVGRRFGYGSPDFEIVGVVRDSRNASVTTAPVPMVYLPLAQSEKAARAIDVRVAGPTAGALHAIETALVQSEPRLVIERITTIDARLANNISRQRLVSYLATAFGLLAFLIACVGLFGVLSYLVTVRQREIGVRMAIGASPAVVTRMIVVRGMLIAGIGAVIGTVGALVAGRLVQGLLYGVTASDPLTYGLVMAGLLAVAACASLVPARRAASVDPATALRAD